jgi:hypothetical protein
MIDPVIAEDGVTYERMELEKRGDDDAALRSGPVIANRLARKAIETLLLLSPPEALPTEVAPLRERWLARREALNRARAEELLSQGRVEEAAELGLPAAQGKMAARYSSGDGGCRLRPYSTPEVDLS